MEMKPISQAKPGQKILAEDKNGNLLVCVKESTGFDEWAGGPAVTCPSLGKWFIAERFAEIDEKAKP